MSAIYCVPMHVDVLPMQSVACCRLLQALNQHSISLEQILTPELINKMIGQAGVSNRLIPFLPDEMQTAVRIFNTCH